MLILIDKYVVIMFFNLFIVINVSKLIVVNLVCVEVCFKYKIEVKIFSVSKIEKILNLICNWVLNWWNDIVGSDLLRLYWVS